MRCKIYHRLFVGLAILAGLCEVPTLSAAEPKYPELYPIVREGQGPSLDSESLYGLSLRASLLRYWSRIPADRATLLRVGVNLPSGAWHALGGVKSAANARRAIEIVRRAGFKPVGFLDVSPRDPWTFAVYALASPDQIARFDHRKDQVGFRSIVRLELLESVELRDKLLHLTQGIWRKRDSSSPRRPWKKELIGVIPVEISDGRLQEFFDVRHFLISRLENELASLSFERFLWFGSGGRLNQKISFGLNVVTRQRSTPELRANLKAKLRASGLEVVNMTSEALPESNETLLLVEARGTLNSLKRAITLKGFSVAAVHLHDEWRDCSRLLVGCCLNY